MRYAYSGSSGFAKTESVTTLPECGKLCEKFMRLHLDLTLYFLGCDLLPAQREM